MKAIKVIINLVTALAAIAGLIYVFATYGDKIVAWAKEMLAKCPCTCGETEAPAEEPAEEAEDAPAEETVAEEPAEEAPAIDPAAPVADEADFEA